MDIFFLLSGFVLSHVYLSDQALITSKDYLRFLGVRLARIYPLHVFTLGCVLLIVAILPDFTSVPAPRFPDRFTAGAFIANLFLVQDWWFWPGGNWNGPSWSLSAEWLAYLVFPLLLLPLLRVTSQPVLIGLAIVILLSGIIALNLAGDRTTNGNGVAGLVRMACEFPAGCLLYAAFARGWRVPDVPGLMLMLGLLSVGLLPFSCHLGMTFAYPLMVVLAAQEHNIYARVLQWRPLRFLGEISFSLYLTHWTVIELSRWSKIHGLIFSSPATDSAVVLTSLGLSLPLYQFIEIPARSWGRRLALAGGRLSTDRGVSCVQP